MAGLVPATHVFSVAPPYRPLTVTLYSITRIGASYRGSRPGSFGIIGDIVKCHRYHRICSGYAPLCHPNAPRYAAICHPHLFTPNPCPIKRMSARVSGRVKSLSAIPLIALAVVGKELGAWRRWRTAPSRRHGRARPGHRTKAQRIHAGKREKPCDRPPSCRSRRGGDLFSARRRRRGWPGQARPLTARFDERQQTGRPTDNAIRASNSLRNITIVDRMAPE